MATKKVNARFSVGAMQDRLAQAVSSVYSPEAMIQWICKHTTIAGSPYSFKDHEYQEHILRSKKPVQYIKKCSQLGISELKARRALATCYMIPHFSAILTLPTSDFASIFAQTRIDAVINGSETLSDALVTSQNSTELKGISSSLLYIRGTFSKNAAISVPADMLLHDEVDFSDQQTLTSYQSRLTHSKYKWRMETSTPTLPDYGIDERFKSSNQTYNHCKCVHCGKWFLPDYQKHVVVPGYNGDLLDIDANMLPRTRWEEAYLRCPNCGKRPDLSPPFREWVVKNPDLHYPADGIQVSPFDAPGFITVQDLMIARTRYKRVADFVNFSLGQCQEDALSGIQEVDLDLMFTVGIQGLVGRVLGIDMGTTCTINECGVDGEGRMELLHVHTVSYKYFEAKLAELVADVKPFAMVIDAMPYTDMVYRLQKKYLNLYGAIYTQGQGLRPFRFADEEEDRKEALLDVRQINISRDLAFDLLMEDIRNLQIGANPAMEHKAMFRKQMRDMRRVRVEAPKNKPDSERFRWVKGTHQDDHSHHALLYAWVASKLSVAARPMIVVAPRNLLGGVRLKKTL